MVAAPIVRNNGVLTTFSDESLNTLLWNVIGGLALVGYSAITAGVHFWTLDRLGVLRVAVNAELRGLDVLKHNEPAYGYGMLSISQDSNNESMKFFLLTDPIKLYYRLIIF